jgi:hypothetical protein
MCQFAITSACNARCGFCNFAVDKMPKEQQRFVTLEQAKEAERMQKENEEALNYILTQKEVENNDEAQVEIAEILRQPENAFVASKYPTKAAKMAVEQWKTSKGIGAERKAAVTANTVASQSTGTSQTIGVKTWKRSEIEAYIGGGTTMTEIAKRRVEIQTALREGRVK